MSSWKKHIIQALLTAAWNREVITYRDLAKIAKTPTPLSIHSLTLELERLIRKDHYAGRPLLGSIAISRVRNGIPAPGFFKLCQDIGRYFGPIDGPQAVLFHRIEIEAVYAAAKDPGFLKEKY